jgi:hypothetical protein
MSKDRPQSKKGCGFQPMNEGYTPKGERGYSADKTVAGSKLPAIPKGGSGSSKTVAKKKQGD